MIGSYNLFLCRSMPIKNVYKYIFKWPIVINQFSRQSTTKFLIKIFFINFFLKFLYIISFGFDFEKIVLKTDSTSLLQSDKPVNKQSLLRKLNGLFVRIKSMQLGLSGFLWQVGLSFTLLRLCWNRKSSKHFSPIWELKSPTITLFSHTDNKHLALCLFYQNIWSDCDGGW